MTRRTFLAAGALSAQSRRQPNIIILLADDLGYGELGFQGNPEIRTPHLDALAQSGARFTQGYVTGPFCSPSRAGLITGRMQTRFGHEMNVVGPRNLDPAIGLPLTEFTIANHLKKLGYATGIIGKWHLGTTPERHPLSRGFDEFYGFLHEGHFYYPPPFRGALTRLRANEPPYDDHNPLLRNREAIEEKDYLTDAFAREARAFIDRHHDKPFFLYLPFNAIHSPMQAPVPLMKEFEDIRNEHRRLFAAMTRSMDNAVGAVMEEVRAQGLERDTLIFFLSDNGGPTAELTSSNQPLRGGKGQLFEGGIRVPFTMSWPGVIPPGTVVNQPVSALDILPTAYASAGGDAPSRTWDGVNLLPLSRLSASRELFWRYGPNLALRQGRYKLVRQGGPAWALFDLESDAGETRNLAAEQEGRLAEMRQRLESLNQRMAPPLWR